MLATMPRIAWAQAQASDSVVYRIAPASRFEVRTGKAGLFGFAGHGHVVRARAFTGRVVYHPADPAASRLELTVPAERLEVLTPPDTAEIRKVTEAMRTEVLHVAEYPVIRFTATGSPPTAKGMRLRGELTLVGRTRPVSVDAAVRVGADTLRARGNFSVKQTDFGIKPYSGGPAGTVKVANRVTFVFDAIAVLRPMSASDHRVPSGRERH
jgi:polyisoprenoid-binding protein YceI